LSNVSVKQIEHARRIVPIVTVQNRLSPFFRDSLKREGLLGPGVVEYCNREGLGFLAYSPVGGGRLNKKLPSDPVLSSIAKAHGSSAHAVTIAWVLSKGTSVIPIPAGRTPDHVRDAMKAADINLSAAEIESIDRRRFSTD
jgi:pyridoxine 4-dehydrogenase